MLVKAKVTIINSDNRKIGKIPVGVARELVNNHTARVIRNKPAIIALTTDKKPRRQARAPAQPKSNALRNIVDMADRFTGNKKSITENMLVKIDGGKLYVEATDLESHFSGHVETGDKYRFSHDTGANAICVSPERFKKYLAHTEGIVDIHIQKNGDVFGLKIGEFLLEGEDADLFPVIPPRNGAVYTITNIADKLNFTKRALPTTKLPEKLVLRGIYVDFKNNHLVCSDGSRMHITPITEGHNTTVITADAHTIVPPGVLDVGKYLTGNVMLIEDEKKENQFTVFELNVPGCIQCYATYTSIEGRYPNYQDVIPRGNKNTFVTRTEDVVFFLRKAQVHYTEDDKRYVSVAFDNPETKISTDEWAGTPYSATIKGKYTGSPHKELIDIDFLLDCIQALPSGEIEICIEEENAIAWVINGKQGFSAVIMPALEGESG